MSETLLIGDYIIQEAVGNKVYKAINSKKQSKAAIKKWNKDNINGINEISILKNLSHPLIPKLICDFTYNDNLYMVQEWIDGETLFDFIKNNRPITKDKVIDIILQLIDFLNYLHNYNNGSLCFIDLKPTNILIDQNLKVHVIDFESTLCINNCQSFYEDSDTIKIGTRLYTAPEILSGIISTSNDIYSLGGILYFITTGEAPVKPFKITNEFASIITKCMSMELELRYASVEEIKKDLILIPKNNKESFNSPVMLHSFRRRVILIEGNLCFASELAYSASKLCNLKTLIFEMNDGLSNRTSYFLDTILSTSSLVSEDNAFYTKQSGASLLSKDSYEWITKGILQRVKDVNLLDVGVFDIFDEFQLNDSNEINMFINWAYCNYDLVIIASEMALTSDRKAKLMKQCDCIIAAPDSNIDDIEFCKNYFSRLEAVLGIPENKFRIAAWDYRKNSSIPENGIAIMVGNSKYLGAIAFDEDRMLCRNRKGSYFYKGKFIKMSEDYEKILNKFNYFPNFKDNKNIQYGGIM